MLDKCAIKEHDAKTSGKGWHVQRGSDGIDYVIFDNDSLYNLELNWNASITSPFTPITITVTPSDETH